MISTENLIKLIAFPLLLLGCNSSALEAGIMGEKNGEVWTVTKAPDGDTITAVNSLQSMKIRLCGIDAPESSQAMGYQSRDYLRNLLDKANRKVIIYPIESDRYGRTVAEIFIKINGQDVFLNEEMVKAGLAFHYASYSGNCPNKNAIEAAEAIAKSKSLGVWADKSFIKPWEYRRMKRNNR